MEPTEIMAELSRTRALPPGRSLTQRLETLAAAAEQGADRALEGRVLVDLAKAYANAGEKDSAPVAYARLLRVYDDHPAELGPLTHSVHWYLKWMTWGLIDSPAVPLPVTRRWLDELENRYRAKGYSARPVLALRADLARDLGDHAQAARLTRSALFAERDSMADCEACERDSWGTTAAAAGDDRTALDYWQPVLDGEWTCAEQPHRVASKALLPLVRTGRVADARRAHLVGYPLVRHVEDLRDAVGRHLEFCALTGNEARGLELLTEHLGWLTEPGADAAMRLSFLGGVCVLLDRLGTLGFADLPLGAGTVASTRAALGLEIGELTARYDRRNGSDVVGARVAARLAQGPLLDQLPLGIRVALPRRSSPRAQTELGVSWTSDPGIAVRTSNPRATERARNIGDAAPDSDPQVACAAQATGDAARSSESAQGSLDPALAESAEAAVELARQAATHLLDDPELAERQLRRALTLGARALPAEHLARLGSQLVMVISGQPGREEELADAALRAAARWDGISEADATHLTFVAARAFFRAGRHGEAAALFEQPIEAGASPYPDTEMAVLRSQYGKSLTMVGRHREAARQFAEAARLVEDQPGQLRLRAELAASAASALDACGADDQARVAYLRAAELWGELDRVAARARCVRSAAWLQFWGGGGKSGEEQALTALRELVAELERREPSHEVAAELTHTRRQLANMEAREQ